METKNEVSLGQILLDAKKIIDLIPRKVNCYYQLAMLVASFEPSIRGRAVEAICSEFNLRKSRLNRDIDCEVKLQARAKGG